MATRKGSTSEGNQPATEARIACSPDDRDAMYTSAAYIAGMFLRIGMNPHEAARKAAELAVLVHAAVDDICAVKHAEAETKERAPVPEPVGAQAP